MSISHCAAFALDLARRPGGYLVQESRVIEDLRTAGLITTTAVGAGFVIARAVVEPKKYDRAMNFHWYRARRGAEERAGV